MGSVRTRVEALERSSETRHTNPLLAGFPTDPEERAELLKRIRAQNEAIRKGGDLAKRTQARIMAEAEARGLVVESETLSPVAKERAEALQRIREERAKRAQAGLPGAS